MILIMSRVPGELTQFETDDPAAAIRWVADVHTANGDVISVEYVAPENVPPETV